MSEWLDTTNPAIPDCRASLLGGGTHVPISLGLTARATHVERGERDCLVAALPALAGYVGPAARVIDIGTFAGQLLGQVLEALERPKAGIVMTANLDTRQFGRLREAGTTAQVSHLPHDSVEADWPLETTGAGTTLVIVSGGSFGLWARPQAFGVLENASHALTRGDFVVMTVEMERDGAVLDALYADYGRYIVNHALSCLGRSEALEPRTFYDPANHSIRFGALALEGASIGWNGTKCAIEAGTRLDMGAMALHTPDTMLDLHPDFQIQDQWQTGDKTVALLLLRKT